MAAAVKQGLCGFFLALLLAVSARAAECPIVDAVQPVWALAEQSAALPPEQQVALFREQIVARYPGLYAETVLGLGDPQVMDERIVQTLAAVRAPDAPARRIAAVLARDLPGYIARFRHRFPDLRCDFPIYLSVTLGQLDGAGRVVDRRPALVLGVDTIAAIHGPEQLPVFVSHELFHRYHFEAAGFSDDPGDRQAIWRTLWAEGLATYVSARLNPDRPLSDAFMLPPDLAERAGPLTPRLARDLAQDLARNEAPDPPLYLQYFTYMKPADEIGGVPSRAGYYIGYRIAALAARGRSLRALAHLHGPALQAEIQRDLESLAQPSMRRANAGAR